MEEELKEVRQANWGLRKAQSITERCVFVGVCVRVCVRTCVGVCACVPCTCVSLSLSLSLCVCVCVRACGQVMRPASISFTFADSTSLVA